jgi:hypothetical protein
VYLSARHVACSLIAQLAGNMSFQLSPEKVEEYGKPEYLGVYPNLQCEFHHDCTECQLVQAQEYFSTAYFPSVPCLLALLDWTVNWLCDCMMFRMKVWT